MIELTETMTALAVPYDVTGKRTTRCYFCLGAATLEYAYTPLCMVHTVGVLNGWVELPCPSCMGSGHEQCPRCVGKYNVTGVGKNKVYHPVFCGKDGCSAVRPGKIVCSICDGWTSVEPENRESVEIFIIAEEITMMRGLEPRKEIACGHTRTRKPLT